MPDDRRQPAPVGQLDSYAGANSRSSLVSTTRITTRVPSASRTRWALDGDAVVFVPLVARDLRLVHPEPLGQIPLGEAAGDAEADQQPPQPRQPRAHGQVPPLGPLVPADFFCQLGVEGEEWLHGALYLVGGEAHRVKRRPLLRGHPPIVLHPPKGRLVFLVAADHRWRPMSGDELDGQPLGSGGEYLVPVGGAETEVGARRQ
jgi:hypothetical protein